MKPLFLYGSLRDPEMREAVLGHPARTVPASAEGEATVRLADDDYPVLVPAPGQRAEGVLLEEVSEEDLARLTFFEGAEYQPGPISVATAAGVRQALCFRGTGKPEAATFPWDFGEWCRTARPAALEATREYMAHYGRLTSGQLGAIWQAIRNRAHQRARARAAEPRLGRLRTGFGPADVELIACERPYTGYVAVQDLTLRHRRFDRGWTPPLARSVVAYGDAVTVLPYDPRRDRVLLIEQFRAAPFARGDSNPWCIEVVAGRVDRAESAADTARREAREEAGLSLGRLAEIGGYYPTPGLDCEHITSFIGEAKLDREGGLHGLADEHEDIRAFVLPLAEAVAAIEDGAVNTGPALVSLLWLAVHRERLRAEWG